ncbi:MAG: hypothetical protein K2X37_04670 [Chitinophagaceae bacterium]|nr:hypothetical protein [Chitinophagaceae bacterium]
MNRINLESIGLKEMTSHETLIVDGGHDGAAYQAGKAINHVIIELGKVAAAILGGLL